MSFLPLVDRSRMASTCKALHSAWLSPRLWTRIIVPDYCSSINLTVKAIPRALGRIFPSFIPKVLVRPGIYWEGRTRGISVLFKRRPCGVFIDKKIILENYLTAQRSNNADNGKIDLMKAEATGILPFEDKKNVDAVYIRSNAGEAITIASGAEGTMLRDLNISIDRFSSHGVAVYATDFSLKGCRISATGTNACGLLISGSGIKGTISDCSLTRCGGSGVLLAYNSGPLMVKRCYIGSNRWSGIGAFAGSSMSLAKTVITRNHLHSIGAAVDVRCELGDGNIFSHNGRGDSVHRYLAYEHS
eukprot:CAMPEP_0167744916 /NCGR_PEP_ID=MMETSP0110_2-20121227/2857_1 /TAXON_ID=629695 /ORGANISM="Gymnochlora sp., Strain CCMP2014" /LENGTH=301 /DNA_ID=CAMNT_0007629491 /DNA_START=338 /DNA_END=1243 /DNA_ORIENTATION=+